MFVRQQHRRSSTMATTRRQFASHAFGFPVPPHLMCLPSAETMLKIFQTTHPPLLHLKVPFAELVLGRFYHMLSHESWCMNKQTVALHAKEKGGGEGEKSRDPWS